MKLLVLLSIVALASAQKYTTQYDRINVDQILSNDRIVTQYIKCLLDQGRCNNEGNTLKIIVPDALMTGCAKCSQTQRAQVQKVLRHLHSKRRNDYNKLKAKYDPLGVYSRMYERNH